MVAASGWYPDPGGAPGRFRYWDGDGWSAETTTDPRRPAPQPPSQRSDRSGGRGWALALAVLVLLTVVAVVIALFSTGSGPWTRTGAKEDTNSSRPTVSAWDETSTPTQSTQPPPTDTGGVWVDCPFSTGQGSTKQSPGRVAAGGLSFAVQSGYSADMWLYLAMLYDAHAVSRMIPGGGGYDSSMLVGLASFADGFTDLVTTANQAMQCWSMTSHQRDVPPEVLIAGQQIAVSGHPAWRVEWHITYTQGEPIPGEILDVIAVDMGASANYYALFVCCRPVDSPDFDASIDAAIASLTVA